MIDLSSQHVRLGAAPADKRAAIGEVAALLVAAGNVQPGYLAGMLAREDQVSTYLGSGVAIPHGVPEGRDLISRTGVAVLQVPGGVLWTGHAGEEAQPVRLVVGIAARSDEHLDILRRLTRVLADPAEVERLSTTTDPQDIVTALTGQAAPAAPPSTAPSSSSTPSPSGATPYSATVTLPNPLGMHARPATTLAALVKGRGGRVTLARADDPGEAADATRLMSVLSLGLKRGTALRVSADSEALLRAVTDAIRSGLGDDLSARPQQVTARQQPAWEPQGAGTAIEGVGTGGGLVVGVTRQHRAQTLDVQDTPSDPLEQAQQLDRALAAAQAELETLVRDTQAKDGAERAGIFRAHQELLRDPGLLQDTTAGVLDGHGVAWAWQRASGERVAQLQKLDDPTLAARAVDISDVSQRVLRQLLGDQPTGSQQTGSQPTAGSAPQTGTGMGGETGGGPVILLARDLTPSDTARLDTRQVLGFATAQGGPTSHTAIIARGLGLPAVVAAGDGLLDVPDGTRAILDGSAGRLYLNPSDADVASAGEQRARLSQAREAARAGRMQPGATRDGVRVEVAANVNRADAVPGALEAGAEGVGLMRTEFLFLEREGGGVPSEEEQYQEYRRMAGALGERALIIRTLDIGGDKEVPALGLAREDNSFLGIRGLRLCFGRPDLFLPQLRAIYRAAQDHPNIHVMFPMVSTLEDFRRARAICDGVRTELKAPEVPLGIMIEVPSAALNADAFAREVAFFSVGTNDLTQYTLAMDRLHPALARQADAMHPAVLRLIGVTVAAAAAHGKWVGVCGGAAGDDLGALILTGLGVRELSVSPPQVGSVKAALRQRTLSELQALAQRALQCETAPEVRALLNPEAETGAATVGMAAGASA